MHGYDILADVGVRPTAQVYKVRPKLHEDVPAYMDDEEPCYALKCIDLSEHSLPTEGKQRAVRETQALLKLQHTNIARYHKAFLSEGLLCVMSEFAEAGTLHHLIYTLKERGQRLSADLTWHLFIQICHGLKKLHDCSIIHRALKTRNLLLFPETLYAHPQLKYRCKLADLGIPELQRHLRVRLLEPLQRVRRLLEVEVEGARQLARLTRRLRHHLPLAVDHAEDRDGVELVHNLLLRERQKRHRHGRLHARRRRRAERLLGVLHRRDQRAGPRRRRRKGRGGRPRRRAEQQELRHG